MPQSHLLQLDAQLEAEMALQLQKVALQVGVSLADEGHAPNRVPEQVHVAGPWLDAGEVGQWQDEDWGGGDEGGGGVEIRKCVPISRVLHHRNSLGLFLLSKDRPSLSCLARSWLKKPKQRSSKWGGGETRSSVLPLR